MMGKDHILSCRRHALLHDAMKDPVPSDAVIRAQLKSTYQNDYTHQCECIKYIVYKGAGNSILHQLIIMHTHTQQLNFLHWRTTAQASNAALRAVPL